MPTPPIDPTLILVRALDALALRQQVTASNIANVDTPGFRASEVRFESILQRALATRPGELSLVRTDARHLLAGGIDATDVEPQVVELSNTRLRNDGNNVDVDREMGLLAETTLRYNAVTEALARRLAMQRLIASDGRG
ncbi:flagellar basal body rod protein FlgB [Thermomicrobiaceae bacterium CFH 74404]|uniref:Flagellar basal body rod protein FlgB n=2 Tax=Thermomicrobia TaxID=189775 RepID=A0AA42BBF7_9BACT|nr:flagellar basal body rod protein FlgB [Thermalbibacter longus]MCM8749715.1 flagellar basal body rod protein FlgB [Thermalbibacter longus]